MEKLEEKFYDMVKALPEVKPRVSWEQDEFYIPVTKAYRRGVQKLADIAERVYRAEKIHELQQCAYEHMEVRCGYVLGYEHFKKINRHEDLDNLLRNTKIMIGDKVDLVRAKGYASSLERTLNERIKE